MQKYFVLVAMAIFFMISCDKVNYKKIPELTYEWRDKGVLFVNIPDTTHFYLSFFDDDGDLGSIDNGTNSSTITIQDNRTGGKNFTLPFPDIKTNTEFKAGTTGKITVSLSGKDLYLVDSVGLGDTIRYDIYVTDNKGNKSNAVTAEPIYLYK